MARYEEEIVGQNLNLTPYPRMMYRAGAEVELHGFNVDTTLVHSEDDELAKMSEGWVDSPAATKPPAKAKAA